MVKNYDNYVKPFSSDTGTSRTDRQTDTQCQTDRFAISVSYVRHNFQWPWTTRKGPFIATQLNWTQLTQLNSVQPSQSCFCLWRHDLQTESTTGSLRSLIGDHSYSRCERVDNSTSSWVELCRYKRAFTGRSRSLKIVPDARYCLSDIVCPSVRPSESVCPWRFGIRWKRLNILS